MARNKMRRKDNIFLDMPGPSLPSNSFELSHVVTTSFNMGKLIPTTFIECLPGDTFVMNDENLLRMQPLVAPVMHDVEVTTHWWFVPHRLLWSGWEDFITGNNPDLVHPFVEVSECGLGEIQNYLGIPLGEYADPELVNPFPIAAYYKIYDEWYRDQNFVDPKFVPLVEGDNSVNYLSLMIAEPLKRAWEHDAYTSALPEAQQGSPVNIPLVSQDSIPVFYQNRAGGATNQNTGAFRRADGTFITNSGQPITTEPGPTPLVGGVQADGDYGAYDPQGTLVVDIQADATDINDLRSAWAVQSLLERMMRGGKRYTEMMQSIWGASPSDARLQRPEYVGGSKGRMVISQVLTTTENTAVGQPVGEMAGHGISVSGGNSYNYRCEEYGTMICLVNVQPKTSYQQGLHRAWSRLDRFDYPFPDLANIGEQAVLNKEVKMTSLSADRNGTFGYMPQYNELRFLNNRTSGDFQTTLAFWTMTRIFNGADAPVLNASFIEADPTFRNFAVTDENVDHILAQLYYNITAYRKIPRFGIPAKIV